MLHVLMTSPHVREIEDQPTHVAYLDKEGVRRRHTFDFRVTRHDESKIAIALRPLDRAAGLTALVNWMRPQISTAFADYVVVRTEIDLPASDTANAATMLRYRNTRCEEAIKVVLDIMRKIAGPIAIGRIVATTGLKAAAFGAIVNLIDDTALILSGGTISYNALVQTNRQIQFLE